MGKILTSLADGGAERVDPRSGGKKMIFRIRCAWCGRDMGMKEYLCAKNRNDAISHSICEPCKVKVMADIDRLKYGDARYVTMLNYI